MKINKKGFSIVEVLLVLVIVGIVGFVGWYVWQARQSKATVQSTTGTSNTQANTTSNNPLSLNSSKLPAGWNAEIEESSRVLVSNNDTKCLVDTLYTTDTAETNSPDTNHNKQTVDSIKSKGYSVEEAQGSLTITTSKGEKQLEAQDLQVSGSGDTMSQKYAYVSNDDSFTQIQLSCPNSTDLPSAQTALLAIVFSKVN
ncbi:prepilin-type N-terminal cleavage/methylation domain-containing protein [Candidatus Saccharibacteria bacterium]|nr:prepilin-type N-terminal cleavage/methylation domain-containing protein [Candidatus Saccharibacteria bacterium]